MLCGWHGHHMLTYVIRYEGVVLDQIKQTYSRHNKHRVLCDGQQESADTNGPSYELGVDLRHC